MDGIGRLTKKDGSVQVGVWNEDEYVEGSEAAAKGNAEEQFKLANRLMEKKGNTSAGIPVAAVTLYNAAAEQGHQGAKAALAKLRKEVAGKKPINKFNIIGAAALGLIGLAFGIIGVVIGVVAGWFIGGIVGKKFFSGKQ
jgi:hypothetical protein